MATGQGKVQAREKETLNLNLRGTVPSAAAGLYMGLFGASAWVASTIYADGTFVVSTKTGNTRLFKSGSHSGTGTSGAADPFSATGTETDGQTVVDNSGANQINWIEQTMVFDAIADATATFISELSGNAYARVNVGLTNFPAAAAIGGTTTGSQSTNGTAITFPTVTTANWAPVVGWFLVSASTNGSYIYWARLGSQLQVNVGQFAQFNASGVTVSED